MFIVQFALTELTAQIGASSDRKRRDACDDDGQEMDNQKRLAKNVSLGL